MDIVKLKPVIKDNLWGGNYFKQYKGNNNDDVIAECWELSMLPNNESFIDSGINKGKRLNEIIKDEDIGPVKNDFPYFPLLIKLIDAKDNLSIQVHPSDEYALKNENSFGKTEMWHILSSDPGCGIYVGFKNDENILDVKKSLNDGSILNKLNFFEVNKGDTFLINAGTIHAIGKGVRLIEIQQNSNLTYRLYDYHRVDKNGLERELHIDKALKVIDLHKYQKEDNRSSLLAKSKYFTVHKYDVNEKNEIIPNDYSFICITFIDGEGLINDIPYKKYDTFFIPYNKKCSIKGNGTYIESTIEKII